MHVVEPETGTIERSLALGAYGAWVRVVGDVDGDRRSDFIAGCYGNTADAVCVSFGTGKILYVTASKWPVEGLGEDVDGDGVQDFVALVPGQVRIASGRDGHSIRSLDVGARGMSTCCVIDRGNSNARQSNILVRFVHPWPHDDPFGRVVVLSPALEVVSEILDPLAASEQGAKRPSRFGTALCVVPGVGKDAASTWFVGAPNDYDNTRPFEGEERVRIYRIDRPQNRAVAFQTDPSGSSGRVLCIGPDADADGRLDLLVADPDHGVVAGRVLLLSSADGRVLRKFGPYENPQPKGGRDESELRTGTSMACSLGDESHRAIVVLGCRPLTNETRAIVRAVDVRTNELLWTIAAD